jgi:signal transduction histidine kinase
MRQPERSALIVQSWRIDALLAAGLIAAVVAYPAAQGILHGWNNLLETGLGIGVIASVPARRTHPMIAAGTAGCLLALTGLGDDNSLPGTLVLVAVFLLAYSLGTVASLSWSALTLVFMGAGLQVAAGIAVFNPFIVVVLVGPWAIGLVVRSRRRLGEQLAARGRELDAERELFAAEAVRYERARIARELHDIVAHCISVMVIQAGAGQRLTHTDPLLAGESFDAIAESVRQAESEIGRLVELLDHEPSGGSDGILLVDELVARAAAAGLSVSCRFAGPMDVLSTAASDAGYRVVQESLTNALKHAPGAAVDIVIASTDGYLEIRIVNGPATVSGSGLEQAGSGHGAAGMRERVHACGGELATGPTEEGGWQVLARLPSQSAQPSVKAPA